MRRAPSTLSPPQLLASWATAIAAFPFALLIAACAQGLAAELSGCGWIGLSLPPHRQVWALINQPLGAYSAGAHWYWLASLIGPLVFAIVLVLFWPRERRVASELRTLQVAWAAIAIGLVWLPLIDPRDGHLSKWLRFRELDTGLVWLAPMVGLGIATWIGLHLISLERKLRPQVSGMRRCLTVLIHFAPVTALFSLLGLSLGVGRLAPHLMMATMVLIPALLVIKHPPEPAGFAFGDEGTSSSLVLALVAAALLWVLVAVAGRPLGEGRVSGIEWAGETTSNNRRSWIVPQRLR